MPGREAMGSDSIQARGVFSLSESKALLSLVLNRVALPQTDSVPNLRILLELWLLFEEQVAVMARRVFGHLQAVCQ